MSVDGYIAGPNGEMDWMVWDWDEKLNHYVRDLSETIDCIVLGRKLAEGFIPYWESVSADPDHAEHEGGKKITGTHKIVFTKTLDKSEWPDTAIAKGDLSDEINRIKKQQGRDIIVYGGASFLSALIEEGLIDEYHLMINPTILGKGMPIFNHVEQMQQLELVKALPFSCGIVLLHYSTKK